MKQKKALLAAVLALVLLLGGASVLYNRLIGRVEPTFPTAAATTAAATDGAQEPTQPAVVHAPDFTVYDAAGKPVRLSDFQGKPVVLNFWASWCGPCQIEMPYFQAMYHEFGDQVQFMMVNMVGGRETPQNAARYILGNGYDMPFFYDNEYQADLAYNVRSLPSTYFINEEGHVVGAWPGMISSEALRQGIEALLPQ